MDRATLRAVQNLKQVSDMQLVSFKPSPAMETFVEDDRRRLILRAANRVGKTRHAAYKLAKQMVLRPGLRCRAVGPNRQQTSQVLGRYLADFLEPYLSEQSYYKLGSGWNQNTIVLVNGSICQLKSYEDRPDTHAGDSLDLVILDEPPPQSIFSENLARTMDTDGQCILTLTPVGRPVAWLRDMVEKESSPWTQYVAAFNQENCPWYSEEQVLDWLDTMQASPWDYQQRALGSWEGITLDRLFAAFSEDRVSSDMPLQILSRGDMQVGIGIDHGEVSGHQIAVLALYNDSGRVWVIDEVVGGDTAPEEDATQLLDCLKRNGISPKDVDLAVADTNNAGKGYASYKVSELIERALAANLNQSRPPFRLIRPYKGAGSVSWGLRIINYALRRGELTIHPRCKRIIETLTHWKGTKKGQDGEYSHAADALRYLLMKILQNTATYSKLRWE